MVHWPDPSLPQEPPHPGEQGQLLIPPGQAQEPEGQPSRTHLHLFRGIVGLMVVSGVAGLAWGSHVAAQSIKARLEARVEAALNRPIEGGKLRGVSPTGIRLGQTTILPVADSQALIDIAAIKITFDWRTILRGATPKADITLVQPHVTLVQNTQGEWPALSLHSSPAISPNLSPAENSAAPPSIGDALQNIRSIQVKNGRVTLATQQQYARAVVPRAQVLVDDIQGTATILHDVATQPIEFNLNARVDAGGIKSAGHIDPVGRSVQGKLQTYNLPISGLNLLLPPVVGVESGVLNSNMQISATLGGSNTVDTSALELEGTAIVSAGTVRLGQLPEPMTHLRSSLWFEGDQVTLNNTGLQVGDLALTTEGTVNLTEGYNLLAQIPTIQATNIQNLVGQPLPMSSPQTFQWQARVTGPLRDPVVEALSPSSVTSPGQLDLGPEFLGISLAMRMANLPLRDRIPLIEGATYAFRPDGAWFTLTDGTIVPPLSRGAYQQGAAQLGSGFSPGMDRKFFWLLQSSPYVTAIAADLGRGKLGQFLNGNQFDTDRFFLDYFIPVYRESSYAAGLDPGEALWMLDHALRTLQDPLLRTPDATPITTGSGTVGSFWRDEQLLSMQQLILRPQLAQPGQIGTLTRFALLKHLETSTSAANRRLASTPEVMSKLPNVTFGAEEGAIAHALGMAQFQGAGIYSDNLRLLADRIVQNELEKQQLRATLTGAMDRLAAEHPQALGEALASLTPADWSRLGLPPEFGLSAANQVNGTNTLSVLVSRSEKAGYPLALAYQNSRALMVELLDDRAHLPNSDRFIYALLKDHAFTPRFWDLLAQRLPPLADKFTALATNADQYRQVATQGATLHEQFYAAMVQEGQDISVSAMIKHAVGFQAHLASLIDQAFAPADPADPRYLAFRRSLAIYLRESPDISVYGGTEAALRLYGHETLNVQEMLAVDLAAAPRIRALARLYDAAWQGGLITQWDVPGFQRILLTGALIAAGVERQDLPADLAGVGFPSAEFRRDVLFAVGPEGIKLEATRLGVQAHDHRVGFQPVQVPPYRVPSFDVTDPNACPSQPEIQAIALGPQAEFVWYPTIQRVVLKRGARECPLLDPWQTLFFDTLLETVPVVHSPAGAAALQVKLREAQLLEAGIF
jgi:hypothetical protein